MADSFDVPFSSGIAQTKTLCHANYKLQIENAYFKYELRIKLQMLNSNSKESQPTPTISNGNNAKKKFRKSNKK